MGARRLIERSTYGPETLNVLGQAFDEAWSTIAHHFGTDDAQQEAARLRLAHAVLAIATADSPTVHEVRDSALKVMALSYPHHLGAKGPNAG